MQQIDPNARLSEHLIEESFHLILKQALIQAQSEGLIEQDLKDWTESEIQLTTASLSLYFAALQAKGLPPTISAPIPNNSKGETFILSQENCPESFISFFILWQVCVSKIQRLNLDNRHDLALILCEKEPQNNPVQMEVIELGRDLKLIGLDIVQRQTFKKRFNQDLEHAKAASLRINENGRYDAPPKDLPSIPPATQLPPYESEQKQEQSAPPPLPKRESLGSVHRPLPRPPVPIIAIEPPAEEDETLMKIRETLFAALGDCIATNKDLAKLLQSSDDQLSGNNKEWTSRAYFASLCLSILDVSLIRVHLAEVLDLPLIKRMNSNNINDKRNSLHTLPPKREQESGFQQSFVKTVNLDGQEDHNVLNLQHCPSTHQKFLMTLFTISRQTQMLSKSDDQFAIENVMENDRETKEEELLIPSLKKILLGNVVINDNSSSFQTLPDPSLQSILRESSLMINRMALAIFEIPSFRQRQVEVFQILRAITAV